MIRWPALLLQLLLLVTPLALPLHAETSPENAARLQAYRLELEELKNMGPADTEFRANAGLAFTQKFPEWAGFSRGADIDKDLIKPFEAAQTELVKDRLQQNWELRRQQVKQIQQRQNHLRALEQGHRNTEDQAAGRLREIREARIEKNNRLDTRLKAEQKQLRQQMASARIEGQKVRETRLNLQNSIKSDEVRALQRSMAADRQKYNMLKKSAARGEAWGNKGTFIVGAIMSGISAELEENALAEQEGRPPSKLNKATNFVKNISGYAAISGAYTNIQIAETEGYIKTLETYEALGYDITSATVQRWAANAATTAKIRATVYEGAKLAPIAGDLISIKEGFDAAGEAYVAAEETGYISANNEEVQFQTSLRAAMGVEGRVKRLETLGDQARLLIASMGNLKGQILTMETGASAQREQIREALQLIEAYQRLTESLSGSGATGREGPALDALLTGFNQVIKTADAQSGHLQRVMKEHQSGQLTAAGVATQVQFISAHLEPALADYTRLQQDLVRLEELAAGAELAAQAPQAVEFLRRSKVVMEQQGERSNLLYQTYRDQAEHLEELLKEVQTLRSEMTKALSYAGTSTHLQPEHRDRISAALERANRVSVDQTAARRALDDARGLGASTEMVGALAALDQLPTTPDNGHTAAPATRAQQALATLAAPRQAAADSLERARTLLSELTALAGDAQALEIESPVKDVISVSTRPLQGLFKGKNWRDITPEEIEKILENKTSDNRRANNTFLGYQSAVNNGESCKQNQQDFCPSYDYLYRVLTADTASWRESTAKGKSPYWIAAELKTIDISNMITSAHDAPYHLRDYPSVKNEMKRESKDGLKYEFFPLQIPYADEAIIQKTTYKSSFDINVHARKGPLVVRTKIDIGCQMKPYKVDGRLQSSTYLSPTDMFTRPEHITKRFDKKFIGACEQGYDKIEDLQRELISNLFKEADQVLENMRINYFFKPIDFRNIGINGIPVSTKSSNLVLKNNKTAYFHLSRKNEIKRPPHTHEMYDTYDIRIEMFIPSGYKSWNQLLSDVDMEFRKKHESNIGNNQKDRPVNVTVSGADYALMSTFDDKYEWSDFVAYYQSERLYFRIANIGVSITAKVKGERPGTKTIELANAIATTILHSPRGW